MPLPEETYRALVEQSPALVWRSGRDGRVSFVNATWLRFTGSTLEEELHEEGWVRHFHPDDVDRAMASYLDAFSRRAPFQLELRFRHHDGGYRWIHWQGTPEIDDEGQFAGFVGAGVDIGDRPERAAGGEIDFFDMSLDHFCVSGLDGYFKRLNRSWRSTLGWTPEEMMARPSIELVHPDDREATLAARARLGAGEEIRELVNRYRCKDGSYRWLAWRSIAHEGRGVVYAVARDVTAEKTAAAVEVQLQRQLVQADRMASVGTLAAGVAHEINNPLTYVTANLDLLFEELRASGGAPAWNEMLTEALEGAERIRKIVRELATFSRIDDETRQVLDVRTVIERAVRMSHNELRHRATLVRDYRPAPPVEADEARLGQVVLNLLVNAAQALPEASAGEQEIRVITDTDARGWAVIEVQDTGVGIPPEVLGRIFDPFFTTKPLGVGTGLGLSICHSIVTGIGGEIGVGPGPERGTSVRVALPPAVSRAEAPELPAVVSEAARPNERRASVLVVDDERAIGLVLERMLRVHDVTFVSGAQVALDLLATGASFDVIFSDLMMPGMSGMDLYAALLPTRPDMAERIVFVSGGAFTETAARFLERVANERIEKPFDAAEVRALVQRRVRG